MEIKIIGFLVLQTSGSVGKYEKNDGSGKFIKWSGNFRKFTFAGFTRHITHKGMR